MKAWSLFSAVYTILRWRQALLPKSAVVVVSGLLVAYLLGIVGGSDPAVWKYMVEGICDAGSSLPSFATLIDSKSNRILTRVDVLSRSNPLDSGDLDTIAKGGCSRVVLNAPGQTGKLFVIWGQRERDDLPYRQDETRLEEKEVCRATVPDLDETEASRVETVVRKIAKNEQATLRTKCPRLDHAVTGPIFVVGGEMPGAPGHLDFSRRGAFISVTLDGYWAIRQSSEQPTKAAQAMTFWLLIPAEHTLLVQRTTPAPVAVIPTNRGTLFQFSVSLLPFPKGGDASGQFQAGALSFVYESDLRTSLRDYLVFVLAAVFAFAIERVADALAKRPQRETLGKRTPVCGTCGQEGHTAPRCPTNYPE